MNKNLETECKVLLNSEDYNSLYNYFNLDKLQPIKQMNYYFDTLGLNLATNGYNMRVRHIITDDKYILTVKIPQRNESNLEINQEINYNEFVDLIQYGKVPDGFINDEINKFNKDSILLLSSLLTTRYEFEYKLGLLALDYNQYNNRYDYEIEFEGSNIDYCKSVIGDLLTSLNIEYEFSKVSKRKRALESRF